MRIMLDTNVLISLLLFPNQRMNRMMEFIFSKHDLVLSSFVVDELKDVVERKFPHKLEVVDKLLSKMSYELVYTPSKMNMELFTIRDLKDYPVLYTAMFEDVDILISGDKDFENVDVDRPVILTPSEFIDLFVNRIV